MGVITVRNENAWKEQLERAKGAKTPTVVEFCRNGCGYCQAIDPVVTELATKYADATFLRVDAEALAGVLEEWDFNGTPSFFFLQDGIIAAKIVGAAEAKLRETADKHLVVPGISRRYNVIRSHN